MFWEQVREKPPRPKEEESRAGGRSHLRRGNGSVDTTVFECSSGSYIRLVFLSDGENVPESLPVMRPSRRAKTAALEKTKLDLNPLINQEANVS